MDAKHVNGEPRAGATQRRCFRRPAETAAPQDRPSSPQPGACGERHAGGGKRGGDVFPSVPACLRASVPSDLNPLDEGEGKHGAPASGWENAVAIAGALFVAGVMIWSAYVIGRALLYGVEAGWS